MVSNKRSAMKPPTTPALRRKREREGDDMNKMSSKKQANTFNNLRSPAVSTTSKSITTVRNIFYDFFY